eukprot:2584262-Amphidinium_carterae.1
MLVEHTTTRPCILIWTLGSMRSLCGRGQPGGAVWLSQQHRLQVPSQLCWRNSERVHASSLRPAGSGEWKERATLAKSNSFCKWDMAYKQNNIKQKEP